MITGRDLKKLADKFVGEHPSPNDLMGHYSIILEAMQNNHDIGLALYYGCYFDIGESLESASRDAKTYKTEQDVFDAFSDDLEYYCKHGWEYKLEQLAAL